MKTEGLNQEVVNSFIIEIVLISPIEKIITKLNNNEFRDCDTELLNNKLKNLVEFAVKTLGIKEIINHREDSNPKIMNRYNKERYLNHFNNLLQYFKSLKQ